MLSLLKNSFGALLLLSLVSACSKDLPPTQETNAPGVEDMAPSTNLFENGAILGKLNPSTRNGGWANFLGPNQDNRIADPGNLNFSALKEPKILWEANLTGGYSAVAIAQGRAITMTYENGHEVIIAFDAATGELLWKNGYILHYGSHFGKGSVFMTRPDVAPHPQLGPRATPTIVGDKVYTIGAGGTLLCLSVENGKILWRKELLEMAGGIVEPEELTKRMGNKQGPPFGYCNSPVVRDGRLFIVPGGGRNNSLAALDAESGETLWLRHSFPYSYSTPLPIVLKGEDQILFFQGSGPVGVDPASGDIKWRYEWLSQENQNTATPVLQKEKLFLSSGYGKGGALIDLKNPDSAEKLWETNKMALHYAPAVYQDGQLIGFHDNILKAIDFETGKDRWAMRGFAKGWVTLVGEHLIVLSGDGKIAIAKAGKKYEEVSSTQLPKELYPIFTGPALADGILYVRSETKLLAIDLRK